MAPCRQRFRVCLTGPECTGKTTLAARLAQHLQAPWIPEFAREYAERAGRLLTAEDVEPIARGEIALLDAAPSDGLLILDTDLLSTVVYSRHYYESCPPWIEQEAWERRADFYLLLDPAVPWQHDAVRDSAGIRGELHGKFASALAELGVPFLTVHGDWEARFSAALNEIVVRAQPER